MPSKKKLYKITFSNQGKLYELYANEVSNSNLLGFIEIESLVFGEKTSLVVDPSEEKIKTEFEGVKRTYVPMHSVLRIDEVDEQGVSKVSKAEGGNVTQMPNTVFVPDDKSKS
ncbi:MAG: DUF1820 family protein [Gammaproteobacteria bacterium]|nr:hypothetical protein [Gammaproteobacteria bacterium]NCG26241.1 DUF1820 family protein [Verrucomicrobiales bacterium]MCH1530188.1 DUF1820 family protein [Gammaproteobacteria bacterium]MDC0064406.1 DUF1820 family protein [Gammaproteobacteria bacterium]MDC0225254.1 DUF1820 family protein [Gammaproteobacteria bacterium]